LGKFIGTFGIGHELHDRYQPIEAESSMEAYKLMLGAYGKSFAFVYKEKDFERKQMIGFFSDLEPLPVLKKEMV